MLEIEFKSPIFLSKCHLIYLTKIWGVVKGGGSLWRRPSGLNLNTEENTAYFNSLTFTNFPPFHLYNTSPNSCFVRT
jgi:hypothetical protein